MMKIIKEDMRYRQRIYFWEPSLPERKTRKHQENNRKQERTKSPLEKENDNLFKLD